MVAPWKIRAAYAAPEQHVAYEGQAGICFNEDKVARCVAWAVKHIQMVVAEPDVLSLFQPLPGAKGGGWRKPEHCCLVCQAVEQKGIFQVGPEYGCIKQGGQGGGRAHMVQMTMGEEDGTHPDALTLDFGQQTLDLAAGVDHHRLGRVGAPDQGAVLLERRDRQDAELQS